MPALKIEADLSCQRITLLCNRHLIFCCNDHSTFANHVHQFEWNKTQQLRENRLAVIHGVASYAKKTGKDTGQKPLALSNRRNQESRQNLRQCWITAK
jgi:hypothetical protein